MAIRNWASGRAKAFFDDVLILQVGDPKAFEALTRSQRLRPLVKGVLAPGVLAVERGGRKAVEALLHELGFSLDADCRLGPAAATVGTSGEAEGAADVEAEIDRQLRKLLRLGKARRR
jgi:hypothetical protein